ncbi:Translational activator GCN1 [Giardia muris]|uniref:Translational activator GCN1 n=1 Tax=Giardia muris TaxID=5742 RepID=A0A4Z1T0H6_GIAMU|nr:Translational activator GCN1 [Giardia muris]|eukprot:TNJ29208.1 Translational activator GCN1 [Giardia muris]
MQADCPVRKMVAMGSLDGLSTIASHLTKEEAAQLGPVLMDSVNRCNAESRRAYEYVLRCALRYGGDSFADALRKAEQRQPTATLKFISLALTHGPVWVVPHAATYNMLLSQLLSKELAAPEPSGHYLSAILNCSPTLPFIIAVLSKAIQPKGIVYGAAHTSMLGALALSAPCSGFDSGSFLTPRDLDLCLVTLEAGVSDRMVVKCIGWNLLLSLLFLFLERDREASHVMVRFMSELATGNSIAGKELACFFMVSRVEGELISFEGLDAARVERLPKELLTCGRVALRVALPVLQKEELFQSLLKHLMKHPAALQKFLYSLTVAVCDVDYEEIGTVVRVIVELQRHRKLDAGACLGALYAVQSSTLPQHLMVRVLGIFHLKLLETIASDSASASTLVLALYRHTLGLASSGSLPFSLILALAYEAELCLTELHLTLPPFHSGRIIPSSWDGAAEALIALWSLPLFGRILSRLVTRLSKDALQHFVDILFQAYRLLKPVVRILTITDFERSILAAKGDCLADLTTDPPIPPQQPANKDDLKQNQQYGREVAKYEATLKELLIHQSSIRTTILASLEDAAKLGMTLSSIASSPMVRQTTYPILLSELAATLADAVWGLPLLQAGFLPELISLWLDKALGWTGHRDVASGCTINPYLVAMVVATLFKGQNGQEEYDRIRTLVSRLFDRNSHHWHCVLPPDLCWGVISSSAVSVLQSNIIYARTPVGCMLVPLYGHILRLNDRSFCPQTARQRLFQALCDSLTFLESGPVAFIVLRHFLTLLGFTEAALLGRTISSRLCSLIDPSDRLDAIHLLSAFFCHPTSKVQRIIAVEGMLQLPSGPGTTPLAISDPLICLKLEFVRSEYVGDALERFISVHTRSLIFNERPFDLLRILFRLVFEGEQNAFLLRAFPTVLSNLLDRLCVQSPNAALASLHILINAIIGRYTVLEDACIDIGTYRAEVRACAWTCLKHVVYRIPDMSISLSVGQRELGDEAELLLAGCLSLLPSSSFPISCCFPTNDQEEQVTRRLRKFNEATLFVSAEGGLNKNLVIVPSFFDSNVFRAILLPTDDIFIAQSPEKVSYAETLAYMCLNGGLIDYDTTAAKACQEMFQSLLNLDRDRYEKKIALLKDSNRLDLVDAMTVPTMVLTLFDLLHKTASNLLTQKTFHRFVTDQDRLNSVLELRLFSASLELMASVCNWLPLDHEARQRYFDLVKKLLVVRDESDDLVFYRSLVRCFSIALPNTPAALVLAREKLLTQYGETIFCYPQTCPGAPYALAGLTAYVGVEGLLGRSNDGTPTLPTYVTPLLTSDENTVKTYQQPDGEKLTTVNHVLAGLNLVEGLYIGFGVLLEPYLTLLLPLLLRLSGHSNHAVLTKLASLQVTMLCTLTKFGVRYIVPILLEALDLHASWQERRGAADLITQIATLDSATITRATAKRLISQILPQVIPALLTVIVRDASYASKTAAQRAMDVISLSVQSPEVKLHIRLILESFSKPDLFREALCTMAEINFTTRLDGAALTLLIPLCIRALEAPSSVVYKQGADRMKGTHTKVIACECLRLCARIGYADELRNHASVIANTLRKILKDSDSVIRSAACNSLAALCQALPSETDGIVSILWYDVLTAPITSTPEAHGIAEALCSVLVTMRRHAELYARLREYHAQVYDWVSPTQGAVPRAMENYVTTANRLVMVLLLQYLPWRVLDAHDSELSHDFVDTFFEDAFSMAFISSKDDPRNFFEIRRQIARILATSFLDEDKSRIKHIIDSICHFAFSDKNEVRYVCVSLIGDIISDLGAEALTPQDEDTTSEVGKLKAQLTLASAVSNERSGKTKVFVPETAIQRVIAHVGRETYDRMLALIFLLRLDPVPDVRGEALSIWKSVVIKAVVTVNECLEAITELLVVVGETATTGPTPEGVFSRADLIDAALNDLSGMSRVPADTYIYSRIEGVLETIDEEDPRLPGLLFVLATLFKHFGVQTVSIDRLTSLVSMYLSHPNESVMQNAAALFAAVERGEDNVSELVVEPLIKQMLESSESFDQAISSLSSVCRQRPDTLRLVVDRFLGVLSLAGESSDRTTLERLATFFCVTLPGLSVSFRKILDLIFSRSMTALIKLPTEYFGDLEPSSIDDDPIIRILVVCLAELVRQSSSQQKSAHKLMYTFITEHITGKSLGSTGAGLVGIYILFSSPSFSIPLLKDHESLYPLLQGYARVLHQKALTGVIASVAISLQKALKEVQPDGVTLSYIASSVYSGLRHTLVQEHGVLGVGDASLLPLIDVLTAILPARVTASFDERRVALLTGMLLCFGIGACAQDSEYKKELDDVTFGYTKKTALTAKQYVTKLVGTILKVSNETRTPDERVLFLNSLSSLLLFCPAVCNIFEGPSRMLALSKKGLLASIPAIRSASSDLLCALGEITNKPEQLIYTTLAVIVRAGDDPDSVSVILNDSDLCISVLTTVTRLLINTDVDPQKSITCTAALPVKSTLLESIVDWVYMSSLLGRQYQTHRASGLCIAAALNRMPLQDAVRNILVYVFEPTTERYASHAQNILFSSLLRGFDETSKYVNNEEGTHLLLAAVTAVDRIHPPFTLDTWLEERLRCAFDPLDLLVMIEALSWLSTRAILTKSAPIQATLQYSLLLLRDAFLAAVMPESILPPELLPEAIGSIKRCAEKITDQAKLGILTEHLILPLKTLLTHKSSTISREANELFVTLFALQTDLTLANSILAKVRVEDETLADELMDYANLLRKRIKNGTL